MPAPTDTGREKYPPNGYYLESTFEQDYPCTCKPECDVACTGSCGCEACDACYNDFLSME